MPQTILAPRISLLALRALADEDGALTKEGLCVFWTVVSTVVCTAMYKLGRYYSPVLFPVYATLSKRDRAEWDVRYSSMIFSFLSVWYAYVVLWDSDFFYKDGEVASILRSHNTTYTALGIALGYFFVDFVCSLKYYMGGTPMLLHHIFSLVSVLTAIGTGQGHMHTLWMLVTEATTPFINLRWWFDKAGMKSSPLYLYNGMAIFFGWILARIVLFVPFFYVAYYLQNGDIALLAPMSKVLLYGVPMLLTVLNLMWFEKIFRGVVKLLTVKPKAA